MKLKKDDEVQVMVGKDKGKKGKVEQVLTKQRSVLVPLVNQYKRHVKKRSQTDSSEIRTITKPLPVENVMLICPKCHVPTRVGYKVEGEKKVRQCKKCESTFS